MIFRLSYRSITSVLVIALIVGAGAGSFLVTRALLPSGGKVEAQTPDEPSPRIQEIIENTAADEAKPRFRGDVNGFTIVDDADARPPVECEDLPQGGTDASGAEIRSSSLDFSVGYLPSGMEQVYEGATRCHDTVVVVVRNYSDKEGNLIVVSQIKKDPVVPLDAPEDRIEATSVNDREGLVVKPVISDGYTQVFVHSDSGYFFVSGDGFDPDEVVRVAESVRSR